MEIVRIREHVRWGMIGCLALFVALSGSATTTGSPSPPPDREVALPIPPRDYPLPDAAVSVDSSEELVRSLAHSIPRDIALADGTYTTTGTSSQTPYFQAGAGHRLSARRLGGAVLRAGLVFGGNEGEGGGEVHGLAFDIANPAKVFDGSALNTWGPGGAGTKVLDSTFDGHNAIAAGILLRNVQDAVIRRVVVRRVQHHGVYVSDCCDDNLFDNAARARTITDLDVVGVRDPDPGSTDGTAEFGVWIGNGVVNPVERLRIEHAWLGGLWTGSSSRDTRFRDLTIGTVDGSRGVAVYNEHRTVSNTFERFKLGPNVGTGFNCEWNYGRGPGACNDNLFQDGVIDSQTAGVFLDEGQVDNTVRRVTFLNQSCAAIVDNKGSGNTYYDNDYTGIGSRAAKVVSYCD